MQTWSGEFNSKIYPKGYASGVAEIKVNPDQTHYTTPLKIIYTGFYRKGDQIETQAQIEDNLIKSSLPSGQQLTFRIISQNQNCIQGEYNSKNPSDYGNFFLIPRELWDQDMLDYHSLMGSQYPTCQII